jgi:hypothetical protein
VWGWQRGTCRVSACLPGQIREDAAAAAQNTVGSGSCGSEQLWEGGLQLLLRIATAAGRYCSGQTLELAAASHDNCFFRTDKGKAASQDRY